jgi:hypothetical protein
MSIKSAPWKAGIMGFSLIGLVAACAVGYGGGGYDGSVGVGYVGGFYEPCCYDYGGWGGGGGRYHVGPPRGGDRHDVGHGRAAPSIPSHSRPHR